MTKLKTLILTLAAVVVTASVAHAQVDDRGTAVIYNSVASNLPINTIEIDCSKQQNIAVQWTLTLNGAGTEVHGIRFVGIAEPGTRPSTPTLADGFYMAIAANGTTPVIVNTNFNTKGFSRLSCTYMTNGTAGLATNNVKVFTKRNAP